MEPSRHLSPAIPSRFLSSPYLLSPSLPLKQPFLPSSLLSSPLLPHSFPRCPLPCPSFSSCLSFPPSCPLFALRIAANLRKLFSHSLNLFIFLFVLCKTPFVACPCGGSLKEGSKEGREEWRKGRRPVTWVFLIAYSFFHPFLPLFLSPPFFIFIFYSSYHSFFVGCCWKG